MSFSKFERPSKATSGCVLCCFPLAFPFPLNDLFPVLPFSLLLLPPPFPPSFPPPLPLPLPLPLPRPLPRPRPPCLLPSIRISAQQQQKQRRKKKIAPQRAAPALSSSGLRHFYMSCPTRKKKKRRKKKTVCANTGLSSPFSCRACAHKHKPTNPPKHILFFFFFSLAFFPRTDDLV